jgi:hypothetical protein
MTFQSAFSSSDFAFAILLSHRLVRSPDCKVVSKLSVAGPTLESTSNFVISTFDDLDFPGSAGLTETILPPKPKDAVIGLSSHFGAFSSENDEVCGAVCAFEKKSSPSAAKLASEACAAAGFVFWSDCTDSFPSNEAVAKRFGL